MKWWIWAAGGLLFVIAGAAVWFAFGNPEFVLGLATAAVVSAFNAIKAFASSQIAKDFLDPEVDRKNKEAAHKPAGPIPEGTGVTTGKVTTQPAATKRNRPKP